jgi:hypothetical protein
MLTTAEEDRLERELPLTFDVEYAAPTDDQPQTYAYELTPFWAGGDADGADASDGPEYPSLVFDYDNEGVIDEARQPIGDVAAVDAATGGATVDEHHVERAMDDLSFTVAVEAVHDANGVPPQVRAQQIARQLYRFVRFHLDLSEPGANGERPMVVELFERPTRARVERTFRVEFPVRFRHVEHATIEQDAVDDVEYSIDTN